MKAHRERDKRETLDGPCEFGPYEVYERLGIGGMATVHRAKERGIAGFERIVALKRLLPHLAEDETIVRSFVREAKLAAMLSHVNIVQVFELGRVRHNYSISMEYIEGQDVRKVLRRAAKIGQPPPIEVTLSILTQLSSALAYAHSRCDEHGQPLGLIHRDVTPSNLLVNDQGYIKVIDFGIAKARSAQLQTQSRGIKGKIAYLAPEALLNIELDGRSDLFSFGVIAYELLTASPLFASSSEVQTLQRIQAMDIAAPSRMNPECPVELDDLVARALARNRENRWQSGREIEKALGVIAERYGFNCEPRAVAEWMNWAVASGTPVPLGVGAGGGSMTPWPGSGSSVPPLENDEGIADIAWEGRSSPGVVLLEDVPDVSGRAEGLATAEETGESDLVDGSDESRGAGDPSSLPGLRARVASRPTLWPTTFALMLVSALVWAMLIAVSV